MLQPPFSPAFDLPPALKRILPGILALAAGLVFAAQGLLYAHTGSITMDEGTYLAKGLLYVTGEYRPFQPYGPWTNKMPLAFLIPGAAQAIFGPGLRTGRYFAVFLGLLGLLGLWLAARRSAGPGWAAAAAWLVAANPATVSYYSQATSQGIIACLMCWSLALALGEKRRLWETTLSAALSALVVVTRQNMAPVVPFFVAFIFWQHGRRAGWWALGIAVLVLGVVHAVYYPNIMLLWLGFMPRFLREFFNPTTAPAGSSGTTAFAFTSTPLQDWYVLWEGVRYNFFAVAGTLCAWILFPWRSAGHQRGSLRSLVFLSSLFAVLFGLHYWASTAKDYCPFCFSGYLSFFSQLGVLIPGVTFAAWQPRPGRLRQALAVLAVLAGSTGVGYGAWQELYAPLLNLSVPRLRGMQFVGGSTELWRLLSNKFGISYENLQMLLPALAGLGAGTLILLAACWASRKKRLPSCGAGALLIFLALGALLTPTRLLSGARRPVACGGRDVIAAHEAAGAHLKSLIPAGAQVYWQNDLSPLPLLYLLPDVRIYPPQLNHWYSYVKGGDPDSVLRRGFWNAELMRLWLDADADYAVLADQYVVGWNNNTARSALYDELSPTPRLVPCERSSVLHIFKRK